MAENLYTVQKTYEALVDPTKDTAIEQNLKFDDTRIFKTEFDRQMYLVSLKGEDLQAAITWLKDSKNKNTEVTNQIGMLELLESKKDALTTIQAQTREALAAMKLGVKAFFTQKNNIVVAPAQNPISSVVTTPPLPLTSGIGGNEAVVTTPAKKTETLAPLSQKVESISESQYAEIEEILGNKETDATSSVRKNAKAIVDTLKKGTKLGDVKGAIDSLLDVEQDGEDFQKALEMTPDGGVIGPVTIKKFLEKAGVDTKEINVLMSKLQGKGGGQKSTQKDDSVVMTAKAPKTSKLTLDATSKDVISKKETDGATLTTNDAGKIISIKTRVSFTGTVDQDKPIVYGNGDRFSGVMKNGISEGKGKLILVNGDVYEGNFKDGKIEGKGKYTYKDGDIYEGIWKDEEFYTGTVKDGKGKEIAKYKDGKKVESKAADVAKPAPSPLEAAPKALIEQNNKNAPKGISVDPIAPDITKEQIQQVLNAKGGKFWIDGEYVRIAAPHWEMVGGNSKKYETLAVGTVAEFIAGKEKIYSGIMDENGGQKHTTTIKKEGDTWKVSSVLETQAAPVAVAPVAKPVAPATSEVKQSTPTNPPPAEKKGSDKA